jgi:acyl carrier protein
MKPKRADKDVWDKLYSATPLVLGLFVTGIGVIFSSIYQREQAEISKIALLDKFRPLLISSDAIEREFAYSCFVALGQETLAAKITLLVQNRSAQIALHGLNAPDSSFKEAISPLNTIQNKNSRYTKLARILQEQLGLPFDKISPISDVRKDLGADDLDFVELTMAIEEVFGVLLSDNEVATVHTVNDWLALLTKRLQQKA